MSIAHEMLGFLLDVRAPWRSDWIWGCPLIVITVILHVLGIQSIGQRAVAIHRAFSGLGYSTVRSATLVGVATLLATLLHAIEAAIWGVTYMLIGALADVRSAMLYSLGALTTYGHQSVFLEDHWRLLGAIEALNGWLLFGLSTAFLFWLMQEVSPRNQADS
jgi:hypothetical protein